MEEREKVFGCGIDGEGGGEGKGTPYGSHPVEKGATLEKARERR